MAARKTQAARRSSAKRQREKCGQRRQTKRRSRKRPRPRQTRQTRVRLDEISGRQASSDQDVPIPSAVARLREICLALPETAEVEAWGEPTFRVKDKIFAMHASSGDSSRRRPAGSLDSLRQHGAGPRASRASRSLLQAAVRGTEWMDRRVARQQPAVGGDRGAAARWMATARAEKDRGAGCD